MRVELTSEELKYALSLGQERFNRSVKRGQKDPRAYQQKANLKEHRLGACCELAALKMEGLPLKLTIDSFKRGGDIPGEREIRGSDLYNDLLIREDDVLKCKDRKFGKVRQLDLHLYLFCGWRYGREGPALGRLLPADRKFKQAAWIIPFAKLREWEDNWLQEEDK